MEERRKRVCAKCEHNLVAREGMNIIYCLSPKCDWAIQAKRETDKKIPTVQEQKLDWGIES